MKENDITKRSNIKSVLPVVNKMVYELRYEQGYAYLDLCGRILTMIERAAPQWVLDSNVSPQGASLNNVETGTQFRFGVNNLALSWEQAKDDDELTDDIFNSFLDQANGLTALICDQLGIAEDQLSRIGFRVWYLFAADSRAGAEQWLRSLGCWSVSDKLVKGFGGKCDSAAVTVVLACEDRSYRLNFSTAERNTQVEVGSSIISLRARALSKAQRGVLSRIDARQAAEADRKRSRYTTRHVAAIDIDAFQEDPKVLDVVHFVQTSWDEGYSRLRDAAN